jgi:hypothetical protein
MTEHNQARDLVATLRDALHQLDVNLGSRTWGLRIMF